jgi:hypothetical protein
VLALEELERREVLSPVVYTPSFGEGSGPLQTTANVAFMFNSDVSFFATDSNNYGQTYQADLTATNGTITVDAAFAATASAYGVAVANDGTADVVLTGTLDGIDQVITNVETFNPAYYFNGDAIVGLTVTDLVTAGNPSGSGTADIQVLPVASAPAFVVQAPGELPASTAAGFAFPPGFVSVAPWPDANGTVTVSFTLDVPNASQFTLSAGGAALAPVGPDLWQVSGTDPAALQATLDSLVVTPPAGFTGRVDVGATAILVDQVTFADGSSASAAQDLGAAVVPLRFYLGGGVTAATAGGPEGTTLDLGGKYGVADPDELPGDAHTLALTVPTGALGVGAAAVPAGLSVAGGGGAVAITGTVAEINAFLAEPDSVTYSPAGPDFKGVVPIQLALTLQPGAALVPDSLPGFDSRTAPGGPLLISVEPVGGPPPAVASAEIQVLPVAFPVSPSAADVATTENVPVATPIALSGLATADPTELVVVVLDGVPAGASFNHGTRLGNGRWAFAPADLPGLTFTPPAGATGSFAFAVRVVAANFAPGLPPAVATESATFTVTVTAAAVPELPSAEPPSAGFDATTPTVASDSISETNTSGGDDRNAGGVGIPVPQLTNAYASAGPVEARAGATEAQVGAAAAGLGSLFAHVESPLPSYVIGERHPLPPVLPLDQTLPVAGFTESGGDSFALVDKLYRDAAGTVSRAAPAADANPDRPAEHVTRVLLGVAPANPEPPAAAGLVDADADADDGGEWRSWAAGAALAGSFAAWVWLSGGPNRSVVRLDRRLIRRPARAAL